MRTCAARFIKKSINWIVLSINWMKRKYRILEQHRRFISWPIRSSFQTITTLFKIRFCAKRMNSSETKTQKYNKTTKRQERRSHWISGLASKKKLVHSQTIHLFRLFHPNRQTFNEFDWNALGFSMIGSQVLFSLLYSVLKKKKLLKQFVHVNFITHLI